MACFTPENNAYCLRKVNAFLDTSSKLRIESMAAGKILRILQPRFQGLSSSHPLEREKKDPRNEVEDIGIGQKPEKNLHTPSAVVSHLIAKTGWSTVAAYTCAHQYHPERHRATTRSCFLLQAVFLFFSFFFWGGGGIFEYFHFIWKVLFRAFQGQ